MATSVHCCAFSSAGSENVKAHRVALPLTTEITYDHRCNPTSSTPGSIPFIQPPDTYIGHAGAVSTTVVPSMAVLALYGLLFNGVVNRPIGSAYVIHAGVTKNSNKNAIPSRIFYRLLNTQCLFNVFQHPIGRRHDCGPMEFSWSNAGRHAMSSSRHASATAPWRRRGRPATSPAGASGAQHHWRRGQYRRPLAYRGCAAVRPRATRSACCSAPRSADVARLLV